uniref:Uncharacterized protein LOC114334282 n=1 Tax=Diabrotica virgifera virgifera TaxID=50390 RepID=A0A6P7G6I0_DIAVI
MTDGNTIANTSASVDRISVKIPPFWPNDPEIWFLQVENQFTLANITSTTVPDNIVRSLWLGRLPSSTQAILATQAKASLDAVAELADTISEAIAPRAQISEASNALESTIDKLTAELADIKIQLASLSQAQAQTKTIRRNRSNSRGRPYPRDISYSRERNSDICWYQYRFGDQAQKCSPPCKHQGNIAGSR